MRSELSEAMTFVVDDRTFVIGLTELFRQEMKAFEVTALLPLAELASRELEVHPAQVPVEGYYGESPELERFFRLVRSLQRLDANHSVPRAAVAALSRLREVFTAKCMGRVAESDRLLPRTDSPLGEALATSATWSIVELAAQAQRLVNEGDAGLVAVAASSGDPVALCAARESIALASDVVLADAETRHFEWAVSPSVARVASRFIASLTAATGIRLPEPGPGAADAYGLAALDADVAGRCILIGDRIGTPHPYYHWYIARRDGELTVRDFSSTEVWTTAALRRLPETRWPASGAAVGAPDSPDLSGPTQRRESWLGRFFGRR